MFESEAQALDGERLDLGECCRWDPESNRLLWIDVFSGRLFEATTTGTSISITGEWTIPGIITAFAPLADRERGWIIAANDGFATLGRDGTVRWLAHPEARSNGRVRMNDGACDPFGRFWAGSMGFNAEQNCGSLYRYDGNGDFVRVLDNITISNGIGWSPDGKTMYHTDSGARTISAFECDSAKGRISQGRTIVALPEGAGAPDGLCVDSEGFLWSAIWGAGEVHRYSPAGNLVGRVTLAATQPSSIAIGGPRGDRLYITTARNGVDAATLAKQDDAGRLFTARVPARCSSLYACTVSD